MMVQIHHIHLFEEYGEFVFMWPDKIIYLFGVRFSFEF